MVAHRDRDALLAAYPHLRDCRIARSCYDYGALKRRLGRSAALLVEGLVGGQEKPRVGIGGGSTLCCLVDSLATKPRAIRVYPTAIIGRGPEINHIDSTFLAVYLYLKSRPSASAFVVSVPPLPSQPAVARGFVPYLLSNIDEVRWLADAIKDLDIVVVGCGAAFSTGGIDEEMHKLGLAPQDLVDKGVVGGVNYNWIGGDGEQVGDFFLNLSVNDLRTLSSRPEKHVVLVGGGEHKLDAIRVAIDKGIVNTLVTDSLTVRRLLDE